MHKRLVPLLRAASRLLVFTGAGISTGSGIPDYRGPKGVWQERQPVTYQDFMRSESARIEYWDYKLTYWDVYKDAMPTPSHKALVDLEQAGKLAMLVTQNIDGLHKAAGTAADKLVEIHGNGLEVECQSCHAMSDPEHHFRAFADSRQPPLCEACGGFLKPATISFGQSLRESDLRRAFGAAAQADAVLALGSTLSVYPASSIPLAAAERGVPYAIVNMGETDHDQSPLVTVRIDAPLDEVVPVAVREALAG